MTIKEFLQNIMEELSRIHASEESYFNELDRSDRLPNFSTSKNGGTTIFSDKALDLIRKIANALYANESSYSSAIEVNNFIKVIRQCITDLHAEEKDWRNEHPDELVRKLKILIGSEVEMKKRKCTHVFPAWTLGMEKEADFKIGPVTILTRDRWIDSVNYAERILDSYNGKPEINRKWKDAVKLKLKDKEVSFSSDEALAENFHRAVSSCPSIIKVSMEGREIEYSHKFAEMICKTALDAISLVLGSEKIFNQQVLQGERVPPFTNFILVETDGVLWLPGFQDTPRQHYHSYSEVIEALKGRAEAISDISKILNILISPDQGSFPKLANRWATALSWLADGCRERNDGVALAMIGTSLDVLANGGKAKEITVMLENLFGKSDDEYLVKDDDGEKSVKAVVREIYNDGRSRVLHGNHIDRLRSFGHWRQSAAKIASAALIIAAERLSKYTGIDDDLAFRTMPK